MNKTLALFFAYIFPCSVIAFDLSGEWAVDVKTTMEFNNNYVKLSEVKQSLLSCALPNSRLFFDRGYAAFIQNKHDCKSGDKEGSIEAVTNSFYYSVLYSNATVAVVKFYDSASYERVLVFNISEDNYLWFDDGGENYVLRYYYRKVIRPN